MKFPPTANQLEFRDIPGTIGSSYMPSVSANFPSRCIIGLLWALCKSPTDLTLLYQRETILRKFINNRRDAKYCILYTYNDDQSMFVNF